MYLYHLTIQPPTSINSSVSGSFSLPLSQELVIARGASHLELLRLDPSTGKLTSILLQNMFCIIRSLACIRLPGEERDLLIIGSDSGRIAILDWDDGWRRVQMETFGRSGIRRTTAGQYLSADPRGRAIMISAVEKQKLVYLLGRDQSSGKTTITSPMEANKTGVIVFSQVALDVGYDNPVFATLEVDTTPAIDGEVNSPEQLEKHLVYYKVDIGLYHVTRMHLEIVDRTANLLIALPGELDDGPGGVLVCSERNIVLYRIGQEPISCKLPERFDPISLVDKRPIIIASGSITKVQDGFFVLLQTEEGDLFKLVLPMTNNNIHEERKDFSDHDRQLGISYFDTIPMANSIQVFKSGFLFISSEHYQSHRLFQIVSLGDIDTNINDMNDDSIQFKRNQEYKNLMLVDQLENFAPLLDSRLVTTNDNGNANLTNQNIPRLLTISGKGSHSNLTLMQPGVPVTTIATSEMPIKSYGIWTLKQKILDEMDSFIVVSFVESTVILRIGESIEETDETNLLADIPTIAAGQLFDGSLVQVHPLGVRQIRPDGRLCEWKCPNIIGGATATKGSNNIRVVSATINARQVALGLSNRVLVHLEADQTGILLETRSTDPLGFDILCLSFGPIKKDQVRSRFLSMGTSDMVIRILSCDPDDCLEPQSLQALAAPPQSLLLLSDSSANLTLHAGLANGVYCKLQVDNTSGALRDARTRYLGDLPVRICNLQSISGESLFTLAALSSKSWLGYKESFVPLSMNNSVMLSVASFNSPQCPGGSDLIGITHHADGDTSELLIFAVEGSNEKFTAKPLVALDHTPRKMTLYQPLGLIAIIESDHRGYTFEQKSYLHSKASMSTVNGGDLLSFRNKWASCLRLTKEGDSKAVYRFNGNEAVTCLSFVTFHDRLDDLYLAVGVAKDLQVTLRKATSSSIFLFLVNKQDFSFTLVHETMVDQIPSAMNSLGGRLLCGVGSALRLYDIGRKQLLRKCEIRLPTFATVLTTQGWRIFVGDSSYSLLIFHYQNIDNRFILIADDVNPRPVTALLPLDYETVAVADRVGNLTVLRLPVSATEELESETFTSASSGIVSSTKKEHLFGAPHKLERLADFYLGDTIMSLSKGTLTLGAREVIIYTTISGAIGVFLPFTQRDEALLFQNMEMKLRQDNTLSGSLMGRNHLVFRSYYASVKSVIDGDLCETFNSMTGDRKHFIAEALERTPQQLTFKLEDLRIAAGL